MRNDAGSGRIAEKYFTKAEQRIDAFLNAGAARIVKAHTGRSCFHGKVHHLGDFFGMHFPERSAAGREVLRVSIGGAAIHFAEARDDGIGGYVGCGHIKISAAVLHKHINFLKCAWIKQIVETLPRRHFAF